MTDLDKAIAELRRVTPNNNPNYAATDGLKNTILNAILSGALIPATERDAAVAAALERAAVLIEGTAYTSNGDGRSLEPVSAGLVGMDMHHATIAAAIRALATPSQSDALATPSQSDALAAVRAEERALWQSNLRETFEAMCAMRDSINEHIPMPSLESDLLQGPAPSVFCATVAEAVVGALQAVRAEARRVGMREGYALGFEASAEGWNGEYPTGNFRSSPEWQEERDLDLNAALAEGTA